MVGLFSCEYDVLMKLGLCYTYAQFRRFSLITASTNGYDGSMMNGLQSLTQWENDFNHPNGGMLGLLNAIQVSRIIFFIVK